MKPIYILVAALVLAAGTGFLAATAIGVGSQQPTRTVTINVANGAKGDPGPAGPPGSAGPPGPKGAPGAESCPAGYSFSALVINHPGGQTQIATCIKD
jgi:hypothetical protein